MKFSGLFLILIAVGAIASLAGGSAAVLVWGIIFVVGLTVAGEISRARTKEGREQNRREQKEEEDYVNYWGSTQYWEDQQEEQEDQQEEQEDGEDS